MKSTTLKLVLLSLLSVSLGFGVENISKVLCLWFGQFEGTRVDILDTRVIRLVDLNKILFKKCNLWTRIVSSNITNHNKLIAFANEETIEGIQDLVNRNEANAVFGLIFFETNETLMKLQSRIDQDIFFINSNTWYIYEHYSININESNIMRQCGFFDPCVTC